MHRYGDVGANVRQRVVVEKQPVLVDGLGRNEGQVQVAASA
jgi:hypothetical protein